MPKPMLSSTVIGRKEIELISFIPMWIQPKMSWSISSRPQKHDSGYIAKLPKIILPRWW